MNVNINNNVNFNNKITLIYFYDAPNQTFGVLILAIVIAASDCHRYDIAVTFSQTQ